MARELDEQLPLPNAQEAEQATLGACLVERNAAQRAMSLLTPASFFSEAHQVVFRAMVDVAAAGRPVDLITVSAMLKARGLLENIGGAPYLTALISECPTAAHVSVYASEVHECEQLRAIIQYGSQAQRLAYGRTMASAEIVGRLREDMQGIADRGLTRIPEFVTGPELRAIMGEVRWWWQDWLPRDMLTILAGKQEVGKSGLALWLALVMASGQLPWPDGTPPPEQSRRVIWVDTEGSQIVLADRLAKWGADDANLIIPGARGTESVKIDNERDLTALDALVEHTQAAMVIVDSLAAAHGQDENSAAMGGVLTGLADMARDRHCVVLVVHHVKKLQGGLVSLEDLRGSGAITGPARVVIAVDRPDEENDANRMRVVKSNIGYKPDPLGYRAEEAALPAFCEAPTVPEEESGDDRAEAWLRMKLGRGAVSENALFGMAQGATITRPALRNALKRAHVVISIVNGGRMVALPAGARETQQADVRGRDGW